jgi:hypothetical protein
VEGWEVIFFSLQGWVFFHIFLLLNSIRSFLRNPQISKCDLCMHATWAGSVVTRNLLFHTYYSCAGPVIGACTHNHTTYLVCSHSDQHICFNPTYRPQEQCLEVLSICIPGNLISHTQVFNPDKPASMFFDACVPIDQGGCRGIGCGCEGLAWERACTSNDEYMCWGVMMWSPTIALIGVVFHVLHGKRQNMQPSFTRGQLLLTMPLRAITP